MRQAADGLIGRHDFSAFCSDRHRKKSSVRELRSIDFIEDEGELRLFFRGDGFLYNMVRILTGTLLEVGLGQRPASDMAAILASGDRSQAGPTAPAAGLTLWDAEY
jgi:tRNA pseudouridine38-40 synthase